MRCYVSLLILLAAWCSAPAAADDLLHGCGCWQRHGACYRRTLAGVLKGSVLPCGGEYDLPALSPSGFRVVSHNVTTLTRWVRSAEELFAADWNVSLLQEPRHAEGDGFGWLRRRWPGVEVFAGQGSRTGHAPTLLAMVRAPAYRHDDAFATWRPYRPVAGAAL